MRCQPSKAPSAPVWQAHWSAWCCHFWSRPVPTNKLMAGLDPNIAISVRVIRWMLRLDTAMLRLGYAGL